MSGSLPTTTVPIAAFFTSTLSFRGSCISISRTLNSQPSRKVGKAISPRAFVRNPYDRVYSGFLQLQRDIQQHPTAEFPAPWIKALVMQQIAENFAQLAAACFDFDRWFELIEEHQIYEVGRNSSFPLHPAHYWTGLDREQNVNFVGRVENFDHDFSAFCSNVGVTPADGPNSNVSNVVVDTSATTSPRYLSRMNAASISKVNALFSEDFELFGYKKYI